MLGYSALEIFITHKDKALSNLICCEVREGGWSGDCGGPFLPKPFCVPVVLGGLVPHQELALHKLLVWSVRVHLAGL